MCVFSLDCSNGRKKQSERGREEKRYLLMKLGKAWLAQYIVIREQVNPPVFSRREVRLGNSFHMMEDSPQMPQTGKSVCVEKD